MAADQGDGFVVEMFKVNSRDDPANGVVRLLPAAMMLERFEQLIESRFQGQTRLQAELYGVVGGIFADMGSLTLEEVDALKLLLIEIELERGNPVQALALLTRESPGLFARENAKRLRARVQCEAGQAAQGLPVLLAAIDRDAAEQYQYSPALARLRALTGLCALAVGDRGTAERLADQATDALVSQPIGSQYFNRSLNELRQRLRRKE